MILIMIKYTYDKKIKLQQLNLLMMKGNLLSGKKKLENT